MIWARFLVLFTIIPIILSKDVHPPKKYDEKLIKTNKSRQNLEKYKIRPRRQMNGDFVDEFFNKNDNSPATDNTEKERSAEENFEDFRRDASADPHFHSHGHGFSHSLVHGHSFLKGGLHGSPPQAININVNQNQHAEGQLYTQQVHQPIHHQGISQHQFQKVENHQNVHQNQQQNVVNHQGISQSQVQNVQNHQNVLQNQFQSVQNLPFLRENEELNDSQYERDGQTFDPFNQMEEVLDFLSRHQNGNNPMFMNNFRTPVLPHYYHGIDSVFSIKNQVDPFDTEIVRDPSLFHFPRYQDSSYSDRRRSDLSKRSLDLNSIKQKFDENVKLLGIGHKRRVKKSIIPLTRLIHDPNVKLDIPKTIENFGTVTRNAFEDERAPMYHVKNLIGSGKNTLLSAMRIPPQNLIIPSEYEITKSDDDDPIIGGISPQILSRGGLIKPKNTNNEQVSDNVPNFSHTFKRVGEIFRNSVKSGQDTATHIGDIVHDGRNIISTARHAVPRLILPISRIPAVKSAHPTVLIAPKIFDLTESQLGKSREKSNSNFVKLSHLMDAVGISNPASSNRINLEKIILEPSSLKARLSEAKAQAKLAQMMEGFKKKTRTTDDTVGDTLSVLQDAKVSVGARTLRDFLVKMKEELTGIASSGDYHSTKSHHKCKKNREDEEVGKFIETLFNKSRTKPKKVPKKVQSEEKVGLFLPPELMKPFMGRPSSKDLESYFNGNTDDNHKKNLVGVALNDQTLKEFMGYLKSREEQPEIPQKIESRTQMGEDKDPVVGSINPLTYERLNDEALKLKNGTIVYNPLDAFSPSNDEKDTKITPQENHNQTVGHFMTITGNKLKPFMGQPQQDVLEEFFDSYNNPASIPPINQDDEDNFYD